MDTTKTVDARGRVSLGQAFANSLVLIKERADGVVEIVRAEAVPAHEVWLYKNPEALAALLTGIEQAKAGLVVDAPDFAAKARKFAEIEGSIDVQDDSVSDGDDSV